MENCQPRCLVDCACCLAQRQLLKSKVLVCAGVARCGVQFSCFIGSVVQKWCCHVWIKGNFHLMFLLHQQHFDSNVSSSFKWMNGNVCMATKNLHTKRCSQHQINTVHTFRLSRTVTAKDIHTNKVLNKKKVQLYIVVKCRIIYRGMCLCVCVCVLL